MAERRIGDRHRLRAPTDTGGSGLGAYQYRTSPDGGTTWTAPANGASVVVSAEGTTLVQFRSTDIVRQHLRLGAGLADRGQHGQPRPHRPDRAPPSPAARWRWQSVASVTVSGSGSTDAGSGVAGYSYRTSTNGGATWSAASPGASLTVSAEGETLVQFRAPTRWATSVVVGAQPGPPPRAPCGIDRTAPDRAGRDRRRLTRGRASPRLTIAGSGATDVGGSRRRLLLVPDVHRRRRELDAPAAPARR